MEDDFTTWITLEELSKKLPIAYIEFLLECWEHESPYKVEQKDDHLWLDISEWVRTIEYYEKHQRLPSSGEFLGWIVENG